MGRVTNEVSKNVARLRKDRRLSLQALANLVGISKSYLWEIEKGRRVSIGLEVACDLASALGVSLQYLAGLPDGSKPDLHPTAMKIAIEVDCALKRTGQPVEG